MAFSILLFLLSVVETDNFIPFSSGYSITTTGGLSTIDIQQGEGFFSSEPGYPFLPLVSRVFILPGRCEVASVSVSMNAPQSTEQLLIPLAGAPAVQPTGSLNEYRLTATQQSIHLADQPFSVHEGHILSAYTIVSCSVNPWTYDAANGVLGLSPSCTIELNWTPTDTHSALSALQIDMLNFRAAAISDRYSTSFTQLSDLPATDSNVDYLIITGKAFFSEAALLETLLTSKNMTFNTLSVEQIRGNWNGVDVQEDIRNCIKHYANTQGTTFVVLAGDETVVPVREVYTECEGLMELAPSDLYYADLDGSWDANGNGVYGEYADSLDLYADVLLGRLLFSTPEGAIAFFNKNTIYANAGNNETWYNTAVLCGAMLFSNIGYTGYKGCEITARNFPDNFTLTKAYELSTGKYPSTYFPVIYNGAGWNHYAGHGNERGVYWSDHSGILTVHRMDDFSNPEQTGIHSCIGCHTGAFTLHDVTLPEALLTLPQGGGVAGMFNTSWGWEGYWPDIGPTERLCANAVEQVYQKNASSLGLAYTSAKDLEIPNMTGPYDRVMQSVIAFSAFMDPSLQVLGVGNHNPVRPKLSQVVMLSSNPLTKGQLAFKVLGTSDVYDVTVFDLAGRTVIETLKAPQDYRLSISTKSLPSGIYFLSIQATGETATSASFVILK